jgi:hypothetical protein
VDFIFESLRIAKAIVMTFALIGLLVVAASTHEAIVASTEVPHQFAEIDSHAHSHGDSLSLSWTKHGQSHDGSGHDHGSEMLGQQIFQIQTLGASINLADAGPPVYCAPAFDVESPPRV